MYSGVEESRPAWLGFGSGLARLAGWLVRSVARLAGVGLILSVPRCTSRRESRTGRSTTSTTTSSQTPCPPPPPLWHLPPVDHHHKAIDKPLVQFHSIAVLGITANVMEHSFAEGSRLRVIAVFLPHASRKQKLKCRLGCFCCCWETTENRALCGFEFYANLLVRCLYRIR